MTTTYGMAVTKGGTLYGWGKNESNIFGIDEKTSNKTVGTPTPIEVI
jgi:alpha-tubulin suppressor-like RCC1 family protein